MSIQTERRLLQICIILAACVPVSAGFSGMVLGTRMIEHVPNISLDSHFRYLSGLLCGLGLAFWMIVPHIERYTHTLRVLTAMVVIGGLARLAAAMVETPSAPMIAAIGMELIVTPALCLWQSRVARLYI